MFLEGFIGFNGFLIESNSNPYSKIILKNGFVNFSDQLITNIGRKVKIFRKKVSGESLEVTANSIKFCNSSKDFLASDYVELDKLGIGIWIDESKNCVQVYRDIFGQIPFYYIYQPNQFFAFSSNLPSLLRLPLNKTKPSFDYHRIYRYSIYAADSRDYYTGDTFYENVKSALPGFITTINATTLTYVPGFSYKRLNSQSLKIPSYCGTEFRHHFLESIKNLTAGETNVIASQLSGGLDSSSISSALRYLHPNRKLITLFGLTNSSLEEREYARSSANRIQSIHYEVEPKTNQIELLYSHTSLYGHPQRYLSGSYFQASLMETAKLAGANIMLTGHFGDQIVHNGFDLLSQVLAKHNWPVLNQLLDQRAFYASQTSNFAEWDMLNENQRRNLFKQHFLFKQFLSVAKKVNIYQSMQLLNKWHSNIGLSTSYFIKSLWHTVTNKFIAGKNNYMSLLSPDFHNEIIVNSNVSSKIPYINEYENWASGIYTMQGIGISEEMFTLGNEYKIIPIFPFYNKNLYEFSLSVPLEVKFYNGLGRGHFREAMKDILPEQIRTRPSKTQFGLYAREVSLRSFQQYKDIMHSSHEVWNYIDQKKFQNAVSSMTLKKNDNTTNALLVNRAISLAVWLDITKSKSYITNI